MSTPAVNPQFLTERQGKQFCSYIGLVDLATQMGLTSIETQLLQTPSPENGNTAICFARVVIDSDGKVRSFTGLGDASPDNVSRNIIPHIIRMAETRSKARALRDATNIGMAAIEELGDDDGPSEAHPRTVSSPPQAPAQAPSRFQAKAPAPAAAPSTPIMRDPGAAATPNQLKAIWAIGRNERNLEQDQMEEWAMAHFGCRVGELTKQQASDFIGQLKDHSFAPGAKPAATPEPASELKPGQSMQAGILLPPAAIIRWNQNIDNCRDLKTLNQLADQIDGLLEERRIESDTHAALMARAAAKSETF